jgi:hypothetical protein
VGYRMRNIVTSGLVVLWQPRLTLTKEAVGAILPYAIIDFGVKCVLCYAHAPIREVL